MSITQPIIELSAAKKWRALFHSLVSYVLELKFEKIFNRFMFWLVYQMEFSFTFNFNHVSFWLLFVGCSIILSSWLWLYLLGWSRHHFRRCLVGWIELSKWIRSRNQFSIRLPGFCVLSESILDWWWRCILSRSMTWHIITMSSSILCVYPHPNRILIFVFLYISNDHFVHISSMIIWI